MPPIGGEVRERPQDEGAAGEPGMRQGCPARTSDCDLATEVEQIQVDKPGGVGHGSDSTEGLLDAMHLG
jgi:hypothetical protein